VENNEPLSPLSSQWQSLLSSRCNSCIIPQWHWIRIRIGALSIPHVFASRMLHAYIYMYMLHSPMFNNTRYQPCWSGKTSGRHLTIVYVHLYSTAHFSKGPPRGGKPPSPSVTRCGLIKLLFLPQWFNFEPCVGLIYEYQCRFMADELIIIKEWRAACNWR